MNTPFKFNLRDEVRDTITGFTGVITARTEWLNGCLRYVVQSKALKDGIPAEGQGFDEQQLELVNAYQPPVELKRTGGPFPNPTLPSTK